MTANVEPSKEAIEAARAYNLCACQELIRCPHRCHELAARLDALAAEAVASENRACEALARKSAVEGYHPNHWLADAIAARREGGVR